MKFYSVKFFFIIPVQKNKKSPTRLSICVGLGDLVVIRHFSWTPMLLSSSGLYCDTNKSAPARTSSNKMTTTASTNIMCNSFLYLINITIQKTKRYSPISTVMNLHRLQTGLTFTKQFSLTQNRKGVRKTS
jgi:hypothetical protein